MHQTRRVPIVDLNNYLTCKLCRGYFIDATTIIECLHTFCRSCIVQYLNKNKYCPVCDVQVHKTKPLLNIRPDKTLQDIVYKLVPRLFQNEMCKRREFYTSHPEARPSNLEQCGEASYQHILSPDETICLSLNYHGCTGPPRYLRCPTAVSVMHLQKLLRSKYDLSEHHRVDILHNQDCLNSHLTLIDIAYIYLWRRKGPLELTYRIYENTIKKFKSENGSTLGSEGSDKNSLDNNANGEWKEVQLRISENGEMCFTGIDDCVIVNDSVSKNDQKSATVESKDVVTEIKPNNELPLQSNDSIINTKKDVPALKLIGKENTTTTTTIQSTIATIKSDAGVEPVATTSVAIAANTNCVATSSNDGATPTTSCTTTTAPERLIGNKHKLVATTSEPGEPTAKQPKQTILNHTLGIHNLSNNHPLKRHSQVRRSIESLASIDVKTTNTTTTTPSTTTLHSIATNLTTVTVNSLPVSSIFSKQSIPNNRQLNPAQKWPPNRLQTTNLPCYAPKTTYNPVINVPKVQASTSASRIEQQQKLATQQQQQQQLIPCSTSAPTILNNKLSVKTKTSSPIGYKTLRDPPKTWNPQISRASLLKSPDPKYADLKNVRPAKFFKMRNNMPRYLGNPASGVKPLYQVHNSPEKDKNAEATSKPDKIEIKKHSIVKIDPKTLKPIAEKAPEITSLSNQIDLKINTSSVPIFNPLKLQSSPKSDRKSPKSPHSPKPKSTSPPNKRDKLNLNYTPPNPFIPNLASPTLSPNQFLYPSGPPGFPTYDPRIMAAYHSLLYGQRSPYPTNPLPGLSLDLNQRKTFELSPLTTSQQFSPKSPSVSEAKEATKQKAAATIKRTNKESSNKNEKSLENTVEKLTQNRVKELTKTDDSPKSSENGRRTPHVDAKQEENGSNKIKSDSNHSESTLDDAAKQLPAKNDLKIKVDAPTAAAPTAQLSDNNKNVSNNNNSVSVSLSDGKK